MKLTFVQIKHEHLDKPIILASGPRGLSTIERPAYTGNITRYLKTRGERLGYSQPIRINGIYTILEICEKTLK